jgi:hypothetical protein
MRHHLTLSLGIERHLANREPLAELDQPRLPIRSTGVGLRKKLMEALMVTAWATRPISPRIATNSAASQTANIVGPEMVPPGRIGAVSSYRTNRRAECPYSPNSSSARPAATRITCRPST